ncbi:hypothetical protein ACA081_01230 [Candidatus Hodgkinia cicadicola]
MKKILITIKIVTSEETTKEKYKNKIRRIIDQIDEANITAAIEFQKRYADTNITVVSISDRANKDVLKYALAMGANEAIFFNVINCNLHKLDGLNIAKILRRLIYIEKYDLVLVGTQSSDTEGGFVGPALAGLLNWTQLNGVKKLDELNNNNLTVQCILKCGHSKVILPLPCVLICDFKIVNMKIIGIIDLIKAKKRKIRIKNLHKLNIQINTQVNSTIKLLPSTERQHEIITGIKELMNLIVN